MRIGILLADTLEPAIIEHYGDYADMFRVLLLQADHDLSFTTYPVIDDHYPADIDDCDAYLITGSKSSAYTNTPWISQLARYVTQLHTHKKKLIGICFGHQIIARALGGRVQKNTQGWGIGNHSSYITGTQPWLQPVRKTFSLLVSHQDQVVALPAQARRIAGSDFCPNASFQLGDHMLGFQGHPEFSVDYLGYLMHKRREIFGDEHLQQAKKSLQYDHDGLLVAQWIVNFLHYKGQGYSQACK